MSRFFSTNLQQTQSARSEAIFSKLCHIQPYWVQLKLTEVLNERRYQGGGPINFLDSASHTKNDTQIFKFNIKTETLRAQSLKTDLKTKTEISESPILAISMVNTIILIKLQNLYSHLISFTIPSFSVQTNPECLCAKQTH